MEIMRGSFQCGQVSQVARRGTIGHTGKSPDKSRGKKLLKVFAITLPLAGLAGTAFAFGEMVIETIILLMEDVDDECDDACEHNNLLPVVVLPPSCTTASNGNAEERKGWGRYKVYPDGAVRYGYRVTDPVRVPNRESLSLEPKRMAG
jgi:hypothetical protein